MISITIQECLSDGRNGLLAKQCAVKGAGLQRMQLPPGISWYEKHFPKSGDERRYQHSAVGRALYPDRLCSIRHHYISQRHVRHGRFVGTTDERRAAPIPR